MNTHDLANSIKHYLSAQGLPGEQAQRLMAPSSRNPQSVKHTAKPRLSAVLLLLYPKDGRWHLALTKRHTYKGSHSAQISLPGGKMEMEDKDLMHCALRETFEEIGVQCDADRVIGHLSSLYIPISNFEVHPFIALIDYTPSFVHDPYEVDYLIEIPLSLLTDPDGKGSIRLRNQDSHITAPVYQLEDDYIWGATAMILSEFAEILKRLSDQ